METTTQLEPSREGRKRNRESERLVQDAKENVGASSNQRRKRRSLDQYINYMALMTELVETELSSFEEVVEKPVWVDAIDPNWIL